MSPGRHGNYSDTLIACIFTPWIIYTSLMWDPSLCDALRLHSPVGWAAPLGLFCGTHMCYLSRRFKTVGSSWSLAQLRSGGMHAIVSALWKLIVVLLLFCLYWYWCYDQPGGGVRLAYVLFHDVMMIAVITGVSKWLGPEWYPHIHHYQLGGECVCVCG